MKKNHSLIHSLLFVLLMFFSCFTLAAENEFKTSRITDSDRLFFSQQKEDLNSLATRKLGRAFNGAADNDLAVMQMLLDKDIVKPGQHQLLQAMGIYLGELYIREYGVHWIIYTDKLGRSRALQWLNSDAVLFPITMISRRVNAKVKVNVNQLYEKGSNILERIITDEKRRQALNAHAS